MIVYIQNENHNERKLTKLITWITTCLIQWNYESCHVGPPRMDGSWWKVLTKCGTLKKGMPNHFSILSLRTPCTVWKGKKDRALKDELPRLAGAQYATGEEWRNNCRKNEETEPKWKQCSGVDVTGDESKVQWCKEQYCIGIWNIRSVNQGKLELAKQEMTSVNINILGISKLKWTGMGKFSSDDCYIYYCGNNNNKKFLEEME